MKVTAHKYVVLPCLREKMKAVGANYIQLAEASGVSTIVIHRALKGGRIRPLSAYCLYTALNTKKFSRSRQGRQL